MMKQSQWFLNPLFILVLVGFGFDGICYAETAIMKICMQTALIWGTVVNSPRTDYHQQWLEEVKKQAEQGYTEVPTEYFTPCRMWALATYVSIQEKPHTRQQVIASIINFAYNATDEELDYLLWHEAILTELCVREADNLRPVQRVSNFFARLQEARSLQDYLPNLYARQARRCSSPITEHELDLFCKNSEFFALDHRLSFNMDQIEYRIVAFIKSLIIHQDAHNRLVNSLKNYVTASDGLLLKFLEFSIVPREQAAERAAYYYTLNAFYTMVGLMVGRWSNADRLGYAGQVKTVLLYFIQRGDAHRIASVIGSEELLAYLMKTDQLFARKVVTSVVCNKKKSIDNLAALFTFFINRFMNYEDCIHSVRDILREAGVDLPQNNSEKLAFNKHFDSFLNRLEKGSNNE